MKRSTSLRPILLSLISALLIASAPRSLQARDNSSSPSGAIFANSPAEGGHLLITRSPTLGRNVSITLTIDGKLAGSLSWGRPYDKYITPGRHILGATANSTGSAWQATLDVHAGQTYSYSAGYNVNAIVLTPKR